MTKADIIKEISKKTGIERTLVEATLEAFMNSVKDNLAARRSVSLRGFGNYIVKRRAAKIARNITKGTAMKLPAHYIPAFKPSKLFTEKIRKVVK
jgi:DNA-binding protein HU-beta